MYYVPSFPVRGSLFATSPPYKSTLLHAHQNPYSFSGRVCLGVLCIAQLFESSAFECHGLNPVHWPQIFICYLCGAPPKRNNICCFLKAQQISWYTVKEECATETTPCATCDAPTQAHTSPKQTRIPTNKKHHIITLSQNNLAVLEQCRRPQISYIGPIWEHNKTKILFVRNRKHKDNLNMVKGSMRNMRRPNTRHAMRPTDPSEP